MSRPSGPLRHDSICGEAGTTKSTVSQALPSSDGGRQGDIGGKTGAPARLRIDVEDRTQQTGAVEIGGDAPAHLAEPDHADRPASFAGRLQMSHSVSRPCYPSATFAWTIQASLQEVGRMTMMCGTMGARGRQMAQTIVRMGGYQGARSVHTRAGRILGREFLERAGDGYRFDFREDVTVLGRPSIDLFGMVAGGELDLCYFASSYLAHDVPDLAVFDLPFRITSREEIYPKLDGALGSRLAEAIARDTVFVSLGYWDNGLRHLSNARAADPAARGLPRLVDPDDEQRGPSGDVPGAGVRAALHRREGFSGSRAHRRGGRPGEPADQHGQLQGPRVPIAT